MGWDEILAYSGGLKNVAGIFAKMDVWLPGLQCAVLGFVNMVTLGFFLSQWNFGAVLMGMGERVCTCAGEVSGVVAAGCVGVASTD